MNSKLNLLLVIILFISACNSNKNSTDQHSPSEKTDIDSSKVAAADIKTILSKKEIPVLCYHHIREISPNESSTMKSYSVTPSAFAAQMKILSDSGYQTILPDQLYNYLLYNRTLPSKPVMLTFDDTDKEQFTIGASEMNKFGFKGVYFIMTIAMNKMRYMNRQELKQLADGGHSIQAHTWDHHMVTKYKGGDWDTQFVRPKKLLEDISGKPVQYFAYPFGLWNKEAIPELKKAGYTMAFILSTKRDSTEPLYTIRRMIVPGTWSAQGMIKSMKSTFHLN